jgi:hypothetical protein
MKTLAPLACALALLGTAAWAQEPAPATERWTAVNRTVPPPAAAGIKAAIAAAGTDCPSAAPVLGDIEPATGWDAVDLAITAGRAANAWTVTVSRPECPSEQTWARFLVVQAPNGALGAQLLHPGRSHVDLYNLSDGAMARAMRTAANTAARDIPGCSQAWISSSGRLIRTDIVDDSQAGPNPYGFHTGQWRESWLFGVCGRTLSVFIDFTGRPDGMDAAVSAWASLKR